MRSIQRKGRVSLLPGELVTDRMKLVHIKADPAGIGGLCPKCAGHCDLRQDAFYYRGRWWPGHVCRSCKSLWEDADHPFVEEVSALHQ